MTKRKRQQFSDEDDDDSDQEKDEFSEDERDTANTVSMTNMPDYPHPKAEILPEIDFSTLPDNFFGIVYGARRTGKTHSVSCQLEKVAARFDFAYLFSATASLHDGEKGELDFEMIRPEAKFKGFDAEKLSQIMERQAAVKLHNNKCKKKSDMKPNRTLIIFDDFVHEKEVRYSKQFTELPVLGRHFDVSVICLSQGYSSVGSAGLNPATRQNSDFVITFLPRNLMDVERIATWYLAKAKGESMWFVKSVCQEKHRCLGIDLSEPHLTEYEDYCYQYLAPKKVPKYELGKVQWKLFREERKRQKKATLSNNVENDRSFFLSRDEVEKRMKLGQATGKPQNRTKSSLFDRCAGTL